MLLVATALSVSFLECHAAPESKVLATVNGMELTDVDVVSGNVKLTPLGN